MHARERQMGIHTYTHASIVLTCFLLPSPSVTAPLLTMSWPSYVCMYVFMYEEIGCEGLACVRLHQRDKTKHSHNRINCLHLCVVPPIKNLSSCITYLGPVTRSSKPKRGGDVGAHSISLQSKVLDTHRVEEGFVGERVVLFVAFEQGTELGGEHVGETAVSKKKKGHC